ncbi:MAG: alpha/beta fold hydrolase [Clostridiales bacterium]|nr:alpha/beta fold hydrolase [Clostridiales bacterium]HAW16494.1 hypothetical protein [Clostridiales bacterium]
MTVDLAIDTVTIILILVVLMVLLIAALLYLMYMRFVTRLFRKIFRRPKPMPKVDRSPTEIDQSTIFGRGKNWFYTNRMEFLNVRIDSFDKTKLSGYFRPSSDRSSKYAVILLHGYNEHPSEMGALARLMMRQVQCHVLITHMRAHAMSGGKYCTYGLYESVDLMKWIEFIRFQVGHDCKIFIFGRSMGASTALLAAQQREFPDNVAGIIADCPYESLRKVILNEGKKRYNVNMSVPVGTINRMAKKELGFDIDKCDIAVHAGRIRVPVLVFAAGDDEVAPPEGARRIYDNIKTPKRLIMVDHARHVMCYDNAPAVYEREVRTFVEKCVVRLVRLGKM